MEHFVHADHFIRLEIFEVIDVGDIPQSVKPLITVIGMVIGKRGVKNNSFDCLVGSVNITPIGLILYVVEAIQRAYSNSGKRVVHENQCLTVLRQQHIGLCLFFENAGLPSEQTAAEVLTVTWRRVPLSDERAGSIHRPHPRAGVGVQIT